MRESREISQIDVCDGVTTLISWWESPAFPNTRKISRLLEAVAILDCSVMEHSSTARNDGFGVGKYTGKTFTEKWYLLYNVISSGGKRRGECTHKNRMWEGVEKSPGYMTMTVLQLLNPKESPAFPSTRKISGLVEAIAVLDGRVMPHSPTARNDEGRAVKIAVLYGLCARRPRPNPHSLPVWLYPCPVWL